MAKDRKTSVKSTALPKAPKGKQAEPIAQVVIQAKGNELQLSSSEISILSVFRRYLMTPGRMLCLNNTDIGTMKRSLDKLIAAGLLLPEDFKGSYSLTRSGFRAMNELC